MQISANLSIDIREDNINVPIPTIVGKETFIREEIAGALRSF